MVVVGFMLNTARGFIMTLATFATLTSSGCIHDAAVGHGTWIGAVAGAALGAGTGVLISDEHLLGSSKQSQLQLDSAEAVASGALVGAVFGAIVGSMAGHQGDKEFTGRSEASRILHEQPTLARTSGAHTF